MYSPPPTGTDIVCKCVCVQTEDHLHVHTEHVDVCGDVCALQTVCSKYESSD